MNKIIQGFIHGDTSVVMLITSESAAKQMFNIIKEKSYTMAVFFMEQYRYYTLTGNLMETI